MRAHLKAVQVTGFQLALESKPAIGKQKLAHSIFPGEATTTDGFLNASYAFNREWSLQVFTQYERFLIPAYMPGSQHNTSGWFQITWDPSRSIFSH